MRVFEHPNLGSDWKCPICGQNDDKPVVLVGIDGTEDGGNIEAEQYHLDCLSLRVTNPENDGSRIIYMFYTEPIES